jgi:hypothetical protein
VASSITTGIVGVGSSIITDPRVGVDRAVRLSSNRTGTFFVTDVFLTLANGVNDDEGPTIRFCCCQTSVTGGGTGDESSTLDLRRDLRLLRRRSCRHDATKLSSSTTCYHHLTE